MIIFNSLIIVSASFAQEVLFDFDNAPLHSSLPIDVTVNGITAHLSATGQGYSIQEANVLGFTPPGFAGRIIYPNSINLADLLVRFDVSLTHFLIMYSCQELGCDDAATMRVTAYMNNTYIGTNTMTAQNPGTWPVDTLSCSFPQGFNRVVVHYDHRPPTCQDYGTIFMADNMRVTLYNVITNPFTLNLTSIIEGFWNGISMVNDTARVYLRNSSSPYAKADSSKILLNNSGNGVLLFSNAAAGSYYIVVTHRNSIETWSDFPQTFTSGGLTYYNFTTAASQAYGSNQVYKFGKFCIYSGDVNQDWIVDGGDGAMIDNDAENFIGGYAVTDVNGDFFVDGTDAQITGNNSDNFVGVITP